jgi:DNA-binding response OmpR family regulator
LCLIVGNIANAGGGAALPLCSGVGTGGGEEMAMDTQAQRSRILLVEDEFLLCDMIAEALAEHGFEVHAVANAKDALRHLTCGSPCDILLTDINLPGSIDGAALARIARELRPNLPVVYASGRYSRIEELDAVSGAIFVPKPYNPDKLCEMLSRMTAH